MHPGRSPDVALRRPRSIVLALCLLAASGIACNETEGPSLAVEVTPATLAALRPTGSAAALCCCRIQASVTNRSAVTVHVSLSWRAFNVAGGQIGGSSTAFVRDIEPGGSKATDAAPFPTSCASIARVELTRTDVVGLWMP